MNHPKTQVKVEIRHIEDSDYEAVAEIYKDEGVLANTTQIPFRTGAFWRDFYRAGNPQNVELVAVCDTTIVGHMGILLNQNIRRRHVASFGIAVHPAYHGMGVGKAMMEALLNLADNWLNLVKVELAVNATNQIAIGLYEKFGFVAEGESKFDTFHGGKYQHTLKMARFHPDFKAS